jgi:hypothetical protein
VTDDDFSKCPIGDWKNQPWEVVPSSYLRWMIGTDMDSGEPLCDYVAWRPKLAARVKQELAERDRPAGSVSLHGFDL